MKKRVLAFIVCILLILGSGCTTENHATSVSQNVTSSGESETQTTASSQLVKTTSATTDVVTTAKSVSSSAKSNENVTTVATQKKPEKEITTQSTASDTVTCTVEISCKTILGNMKNLKKEKAEFVPSDGMILNKTVVKLKKGSTVFDALKLACKENHCHADCRFCKNGIQLEYTDTPGYNSYYVEGIHQLYEKDCGTESGWMYCVNGSFPNMGCSSYTVHDGDVIQWLYTCDLGADVGNTY